MNIKYFKYKLFWAATNSDMSLGYFLTNDGSSMRIVDYLPDYMEPVDGVSIPNEVVDRAKVLLSRHV